MDRWTGRPGRAGCVGTSAEQEWEVRPQAPKIRWGGLAVATFQLGPGHLQAARLLVSPSTKWPPAHVTRSLWHPRPTLISEPWLPPRSNGAQPACCGTVGGHLTSH